MSASALKAKMKTTIMNGLKAQFGGEIADATKQWESIAEAISGIAADIVTEITTNAQVNPGIPTATGPTIGPGTIS